MINLFDVFIQFLVERVLRHRCCVAEDDEFHARPGDGDVHAAQVAEETNLSFIVGTDEGDEDDVAFLPLKTVNGVD